SCGSRTATQRRRWSPATGCTSRRTGAIASSGPTRRNQRSGSPSITTEKVAPESKSPGTWPGLSTLRVRRPTCLALLSLRGRLQIALLVGGLLRHLLARVSGGRRVGRRVHSHLVGAHVLEHDRSLRGVLLGQAGAGVRGRR